MATNGHLELEPDVMGDLYWEYNLPMQAMVDDRGIFRIGTNYMARKNRCAELDEAIAKENMGPVCRNAARVFRNLAKLFDAMAEGKLNHIYYPGANVEDPS